MSDESEDNDTEWRDALSDESEDSDTEWRDAFRVVEEVLGVMRGSWSKVDKNWQDMAQAWKDVKSKREIADRQRWGAMQNLRSAERVWHARRDLDDREADAAWAHLEECRRDIEEVFQDARIAEFQAKEASR